MKKKIVSPEEVKAYYRERAAKGKYATSPDFNLREVEIDYIMRYLRDDVSVLDVGCGTGHSTLTFASKFKASFTGIDFVDEMIEAADELREEVELVGSVDFEVGDVTGLRFEDASFDIVVSQRCLLNLPTKEDQWHAMREIARVLKPGGTYLMLEGTLQGLHKLNDLREKMGLEPIEDTAAKTNEFSNKFDEDEMLGVATDIFSELEHIQRFGMYYFISRVVHPLLVSPDQPKYDAPINAVARKICLEDPDYEGVGHVALFILRR